jgi:hypothetical protein
MREKPTNTPIINSVYYLCMVAPTYFGITLPSSGSIPSVFWEILNWGAVDRILWRSQIATHHVTRKQQAHPQYSIDCSSIKHLSEGTRNASWGWQCNAEICRSHHTLPSSGSVPSAFWEMLNWGAVDKILWRSQIATHHVTRHNTSIHNILSTAPQLSISQKALGTLPEVGNVMPKHDGNTIHN